MLTQTKICSPCHLLDWGLIDYKQAYQKQRELVERAHATKQAYLVFCEHPSVITFGRMTKAGNLYASEQELKAKRVSTYAIDRGGDITLHAPGQLVIYPILDLNIYGRDLHLYIRKLEETIIDLLQSFGILARSIPGKTGVWVNEEKIASLGIGVKRWISFHGIGLNVKTDLELFKLIRPCGLDVKMASIERLLGRNIDMEQVKAYSEEAFREHFQLNLIKGN